MASRTEHAVTAPFAGVVVAIAHARSERVGAGSPLIVLEAMKMEHEVLADAGGVVVSVEVAAGEAVEEGQVLLVLSAGALRAGGETLDAGGDGVGDDRPRRPRGGP